MTNPSIPILSRRIENSYHEDFKYKHSNKYHDKLGEFEKFVLRDDTGEQYRGVWNQKVFDRHAPLHVEIGTGQGSFMLDFCKKNPDVNFLGIDFRFKRSYQLAKKLDQLSMPHFRFLRAKGERLSFLFGENEIDSLYFFFPDPWPKARHNKKRLLQTPFLDSVCRCVRPGGKLYIKTDDLNYAEWMKHFLDEEVMKGRMSNDLQTFDLRNEHPDHFLASFETGFEKVFLAQGKPIKAFEMTILTGQK